MTREEILAMTEGPILDYQVALKVMGGLPWGPFQPSTEIADAWKVLVRPEIMDRIQIGVYPTSFGKWIARPYMADIRSVR